MHTEIRLWNVMNGALVELDKSSFAQNHKEKELEGWVAQTPSLLGRDLKIIGRQVFIPDVGPLDLLAVTKDGRIVVVEFKRHQTTRDTIAQILDYASSLKLMKPDQIRYLSNIDPAVFSEVMDFDPAMILVAAEADESAERIVEYLTTKAQLPIELVTFTYASLDDGREIIARQILIPETPANDTVVPSMTISFEDLLTIADERGVLAFVKALTQVTALGWWDERFRSHGGTIRYSIQTPDDSWRVLFGMNIGGERVDSPPGSLDVWLNLDIVTRCIDVPVEEIWHTLMPFHIRNKTDKRIDIRISDEASAASLYAILERWNLIISENRALQTVKNAVSDAE